MPQNEEQIQDFVQSGPNPSQSDQATQILSDLFGGEWWKVLWSGEGIQGEPSLIFPILEVFNSIVLIAVAILLVYIVGHAFVGSAHEGTPLGSRMHTIWVPIRAVLSMSLLAPIPWAKSLSVIQGIVLAFVGFSIQFGNMVATTGLEYISQNHGKVVSSVPDDLTKAGTDVAEIALHNYLIQYHQHYFQDKPLNAGYDKSIVENEEKERKNITLDNVGRFANNNESTPPNNPVSVVYKFKNPESFSPQTMGSITLTCESPSSRLCQVRQDSVESLLQNMEVIASERIRQLNGLDADMPGHEEITEDIRSYGSDMMDAVHDLVDSQNDDLKQELELFTQQVKDQGFVMLGSYFWTLIRFNMALLDQVESKVSVKDFDKKGLQEQISPQFNQIMTNIKSVDGYFAGAKYSSDDIAEMGSGSIKSEEMNEENSANKVFSALSSWFTGWTDSFISGLTSHDPIAGLSAWGHNLMNGVYGGLLPTLTTMHAVPYIGKAVLPYILFIIPPLFILGITLAYYLPAVPFIIWVSGIFGWLIMVVEALVAAPIWAAMHANPDGEGLAGDSGSQGYTLFIQVLMRPPLMVIGFFFALLMLHVIPYFGDMFSVFFEGLSANETFAGPITAIVGIFLGSTIVVILVHKAFSMIYAIPEGLMKWMGAKGSHVSKAGEDQDKQQAQTTIIGGVATRGSETAGKVGGKAIQPDGGDKNGGQGDGAGGDGRNSGSSEMSENAKSQPDDHQSGESSAASSIGRLPHSGK